VTSSSAFDWQLVVSAAARTSVRGKVGGNVTNLGLTSMSGLYDAGCQCAELG